MDLKPVANTIMGALKKPGVVTDIVKDAAAVLKPGGINRGANFVKLNQVSQRIGAGLKWSDPDLATTLSRRLYTESAVIEGGTRAEGVRNRLITEHNGLGKNFATVQAGWTRWPNKTTAQATEVTGVLTGINERANLLVGDIAARQAIMDRADQLAPDIYLARDLTKSVIAAHGVSAGVPMNADVLQAIRELGIKAS